MRHNYFIRDLNILEKANFKELKKLNLATNKIKDIKILEKVNFKKLNIIDLSHNEIENNSKNY